MTKALLSSTLTVCSHNSDGMSRTGAFICIYAQLERIKSEGMADVFQCVKAMRLQRPAVVAKVVCGLYQSLLYNISNPDTLGTQ